MVALQMQLESLGFKLENKYGPNILKDGIAFTFDSNPDDIM
jgi:hypothetical protein